MTHNPISPSSNLSSLNLTSNLSSNFSSNITIIPIEKKPAKKIRGAIPDEDRIRPVKTGFWSRFPRISTCDLRGLGFVVLAILSLRSASRINQSPGAYAKKLLRSAKQSIAAGKVSHAYGLLTRALNASRAGKVSDAVIASIHLRRAELLLSQGFAAASACEAAEAATVADGKLADEANVLRAMALGRSGDWIAAVDILQTVPSAQDDPFWTYAHLGEAQRLGEFDFRELLEAACATKAQDNCQLPKALGPLRYESSKITRSTLAGRGRGVIALQDIAVGELLLVSRPIDLVVPGEPGWNPNLDLEKLLAWKLSRRVLYDAQAAEDALSLFDGTSNYGARWSPSSWSSSDFAMPYPEGADSSQLLRRLENVVKYNAHRWPGKDPATGLPEPGLGLWLWPPMINHAVEADSRPNCAHIFIGDVMVFRATLPIKAGEEVLDRYSTPLADRFDATLQVLREHGMEDPVYEAAALRWGETSAIKPSASSIVGMQLSENRLLLMSRLRRIESKIRMAAGIACVTESEYKELKESYRSVASDVKKQGLLPSSELLLAPPEVRCLNLLCPLAFRFEGRIAALEIRAELVRRVSVARSFHFAEVKLWAELCSRFCDLRAKSKDLTPSAGTLFEEVRTQFRRCAEFWCGFQVAGEFTTTVVEWARGSGGFHYDWFSTVDTAMFLKRSS